MAVKSQSKSSGSAATAQANPNQASTSNGNAGLGNQEKLARSMAGEPEQAFSDVDADHYASGAVETLAGEGVVAGYDDGEFKPSQAINQAECLKILLGAFGRKVAAPMGEERWFEPYLSYGETSGMVVAAGDPAHSMTRGEVAHQVAVLASLPLRAAATSPFSDLDASHPYYGEILAAYQMGVMTGDASTPTVRPDDLVNRGELAVLAVRARNAQPSLTHYTHADEEIFAAVGAIPKWGAAFVLFLKGLWDERDAIPASGPYPSMSVGAGAGKVLGVEFQTGVTLTHERVVLWNMSSLAGGLYVMANAGVTFTSGPLPEEGWASELVLMADGNVAGLNVGGELSWEQDADGPDSFSAEGGVDIAGLGLSVSFGEEDSGTIGAGGGLGLAEKVIYTKYAENLYYI